MKNVSVQYNTRTQTVKNSLNELRQRCRKSPGFLRLLKLAAYKKLRGENPKLTASNKTALRALEIAVGVIEKTMTLEVHGQAFRDAYLERLDGTCQEVSRDVAARAAEYTTLDTLRIMKVTVYRANISREDAALLDKICQPDDLYFNEPNIEFEDNRQRNSPHDQPKGARKPREETWLDAYKPLPLKKETQVKGKPPQLKIPEGQWYHSSLQKMPNECRRVMEAEQEVARLRAVELAHDEGEVEAYQRRFEFRYQKFVDYHQRVKPQRDLHAQL